MLPGSKVAGPFKAIVHALYATLLQDQKLLWTPAALPPGPAAAVADAAACGSADLAPPTRGGRWLAPTAAILPDETCLTGTGLMSVGPTADAGLVLARQLTSLGVPLAAATTTTRSHSTKSAWLLPGVGADVVSCLLSLTPGARQLSPAYVRQQLAALVRENAYIPPLGEIDAHSPGTSSHDECTTRGVMPPWLTAAAVMLEYCLSDVRQDALERLDGNRQLDMEPHQQLQQLHGLPLLPMADGRMQEIQVQGSACSWGAQHSGAVHSAKRGT